MQAWWAGFAAGAYAHTLAGLATAFVHGRPLDPGRVVPVWDGNPRSGGQLGAVAVHLSGGMKTDQALGHPNEDVRQMAAWDMWCPGARVCAP